MDNELSSINPWRFVEEKLRRRYDRESKISVMAEIENGKPVAQIACEQRIHSSLPSRWRDDLTDNPEKSAPWQWETVQKRGTGSRTGEGARSGSTPRTNF